MDESHNRFASGPLIGAVYAIGLGVTTALGAWAVVPRDADGWSAVSLGATDALNALQWPAFALAAGLATALGGLGLLLRKRWGVALFQTATPFAAIGLASNHPGWLWDQDVPYTLLLAAAYGPIAFLLSRRGALESLGAKYSGFGPRGGGIALILLVLAGAARLSVGGMDPRQGGPDLPGFDHIGWALSEYVAKLAVVDVLLAHFVLGFVAVALPIRRRDAVDMPARRSAPSSADVRRWLVLSSLGAIAAGLVGALLGQVVGSLPPAEGEPDLVSRLLRSTLQLLVWGGIFGAAQAFALRRTGLGFARWTLATSVGAAVGAAIVTWWTWSHPVQDAPPEQHERLLMVLRWSLIQGLCIGAAQAIVGRGLAGSRIAWTAALAAAFVLAEGPAFFTRLLVPLIPRSEASSLTLWYSVHGFLANAARGLVVALLTLPWLGGLRETPPD